MGINNCCNVISCWGQSVVELLGDAACWHPCRKLGVSPGSREAPSLPPPLLAPGSSSPASWVLLTSVRGHRHPLCISDSETQDPPSPVLKGAPALRLPSPSSAMDQQATFGQVKLCLHSQFPPVKTKSSNPTWDWGLGTGQDWEADSTGRSWAE